MWLRKPRRIPIAGKSAESIEEAARRLRYAWFRQLLAAENLDAVATAHTLDDQAETVLAKFLRGAWTEGLSGIHPVLEFAEGKVVRPLLGATRSEIESYLRGLGQDWREDSSNRPSHLHSQPHPPRVAAPARNLEPPAARPPRADG